MKLTSFRFDRLTGEWAPAPPEDQAQTRLICVTFNIWFGSFYKEERAAAMIDLLEQCDADVIALQEVTPPFLKLLRNSAWVRAGYALSDALGATVQPYGVLLLTRATPRRLALERLPSLQGRHLLVADLELNGQTTSVATVHLESQRDSVRLREIQLQRIFPALAAAPHAVLMGDLNFCASWSEENDLLDPAYRDAWGAVHGDAPGYTEDTAINLMRLQQKGKPKQVRFDRVLLRSERPGWRPESIRLLGAAPIAPELPHVFPSDHFGLCASFVWQT